MHRVLPAARYSREVAPAVRRLSDWGWRFLVIAAVVYILFELGQYVAGIVVPLAIAFLLAVFTLPFVEALDRYTILSRAAASWIVMIALVMLLVGMIVLAGRQIITGFSTVSSTAYEGVQTLLAWLRDNLGISLTSVDAYAEDLVSQIQDNLGSILSGAADATGTISDVLTGALLVLFALFFFLSQGDRIWRFLVGVFPRDIRSTVHESCRRGFRSLAAYARSQILVAAIDAVGIGIGAVGVGMGSYALSVGVLVFLFSFVPFVGAIVSGIVACLLALVLEGWVQALIMLGVVLLVQQIESNVLQPFIMGTSVDLHPLAVIVVVLTGGTVAGIVGALFAVPITSFLNAALRYSGGHDMFPELGHDDRVGAGAGGGARRIGLPSRAAGTGRRRLGPRG